MRQHAFEFGEKIGVAGLPQIVAIEAFELGKVETRRRAPDLRQIEGCHHLLGREDFLIAVAPAQPHEIIAHSGRQISHRPVRIHAERAMPLGQFRAIRPMDERDVRHHRNAPAQRIVDLRLSRGVGEVIVAADDMGYAHVVVVHHDGEHVSRRAVRTQQHEVIEVFVLPDDPPLHLIFDHGFASQRRLEPDHRRNSGRGFRRVAVAPAAVVELGTAFTARLFAHLGEFLRRGIATIGAARLQ